MENREWFYNADAEKIDDWVEETRPSNFGGYYLDNRAGGIMYIGFLGNQEEELARLKSSLSLVVPDRLKVYPVAPTVSYLGAREAVPSIAETIASIPALRERVVEIREADGGSGAQIETPEVSKVEQLLHEYLPGAPVKVGFESAGGNLLSGRFRNTGRMRAGDAIFEWIPGVGTYGCTAGFGAKEKTGMLRGDATWALFTLTAGHCRQFYNAQLFYRSTEVAPSPSNEGVWGPIGVLRRDGLEANTFVKTDAGAIETTASELIPQGIFGEEGNLVPTKSAVTAKIGNTLCFSGAATRQPSCGTVVARSVNWVSEPGIFGRGGYWVKFPVQAIQGDSGAPVYTVFGHGVGLVTACRPINNCSETLVEPLLHPLHMPAADVPGIFNNPYLGQLSLKLGAE